MSHVADVALVMQTSTSLKPRELELTQFSLVASAPDTPDDDDGDMDMKGSDEESASPVLHRRSNTTTTSATVDVSSLDYSEATSKETVQMLDKVLNRFALGVVAVFLAAMSVYG